MKEIVKSVPMLIFIFLFLGLIITNSIQETNKKDLNQPTSDQVNQSYKQNNFR